MATNQWAVAYYIGDVTEAPEMIGFREIDAVNGISACMNAARMLLNIEDDELADDGLRACIERRSTGWVYRTECGIVSVGRVKGSAAIGLVKQLHRDVLDFNELLAEMHEGNAR
jgi:hypothetical protein